ncbi:alpha/beta hydrolase [Alteromonas sp. 14N.309.X.WAT.G.H12]|uniref:alpha/beta hydrolase n=1 Tax=Alteromonas sp. 14N.309.X.WAT.G.H12 TaxID=3120824 RepID=UPI002FD5E2A8
MVNLIKHCIFLLFVGVLTGCAIDVSSSSYLYQDASTQPIDVTALSKSISRDEAVATITKVELKNSLDLTLNGVAVTYPHAIANVVLFADNEMSITKNSAMLHEFGQLPVNVLWVDYQGTGASEKASRVRMYQLKRDALLIFDFAKHHFKNNLPTVVHGISMGSILASYVAVKRDIDGLVLDSAINKVNDVVANMVPSWTHLFTILKVSPELAIIENEDFVRQFDRPLLLVVGDKDRTTPITFSRELYEASPSPDKWIYVVPGGKHNKSMTYPDVKGQYRLFIRAVRRLKGARS